MLNAFRKIFSGDYTLTRVQDNVALVFQQLLDKQLIDGALITITVTNQPISYSHTLGRLPIGWFIVDKQAFGDIKRITWTDRTITLQASVASLPVTIWAF